MTDTEAALLGAIAAMPDEDTPRLAFADCLDERGGELAATRAEFIRLQIMYARAEWETPETLAARLRAAELRERYAEAWGFPAQSSSSPWYAVRRGFVGEIAIDFVHIPRDAVCRMLQQEPVGRLRVVRPYDSAGEPPARPADAADWLDVPALRRVRYLELAGAYWTDRELARVLAFDNFPPLTTLALTRAPLSAAGAAAIAGCERLRDLAYLRLDDTRQWSPEARGWTSGVAAGVRALAASPHLAGLCELSLRFAGIDDAGALALAGSPYLTGLTAPNALDLGNNPGIGAAGRAALVARFGKAVFLSPP